MSLTSQVLEHTQSLDMRHAIHERETIFEAPMARRSRSVRAVLPAWRATTSFAWNIPSAPTASVRSTSAPGSTAMCGTSTVRIWSRSSASEQDGILSVSAVTHENAVPVAVSEAITLTRCGGSHAVIVEARPKTGRYP